ncbi:MAG: di-trans,poly-cis-decaprenylcistransferase [Puniceicoccales bacterium]|nr:di-trans,poly-cis-decaprenylcistransferase [Puniceicoccales bacterium]
MNDLPEVSPARNIPRHTAIIMDGNGRWARQRGLPRVLGHERGGENLLRIVEAAGDLGIEFLTVYAFSVENWQRPDEEVSSLMRLLESYLSRHAETLVKRQVRLRVIGDIDALPEHARRPLLETIQATKSFTGKNLVLALNYGSRAELVRVAQGIARDARNGTLAPESLDWENIAARLDTAGIPDPDLVIRTSGEIRLSNFLLLQAAYAEWYFSPVLWPDFDAACLAEAVRDYSRRNRRFGKAPALPAPAL